MQANPISAKLRPFLTDSTYRDTVRFLGSHFSIAEHLERYFHAVSNACVDVAEIAYRRSCNKRNRTTDLNKWERAAKDLGVPTHLTIGSTICAADVCDTGEHSAILRLLFPSDAKKSLIGLVRIDAYKHEFISTLPATQWLQEKGYQVGINILNVSDLTEPDVFDICRQAKKWPINVINLVDSLGSLKPESLSTLVQCFKAEWKGPLGFRGRDNMRLALLNTLTAIDEGVTWVDSSIDGVGKGAGNTRTEELVIEKKLGLTPDLASLLKFSRMYIEPLKRIKPWGTNPSYYFAGMHRLDSAFVEELEDDPRFGDESTMTVLSRLKDCAISSHDVFRKQDIDALYRVSPVGGWQPIELMQDRDVLFLGHGSGVQDHKAELEAYIARYSPVVISLPSRPVVESGFVDALIACHPFMVLAHTHGSFSDSCPVIMPASILPASFFQSLDRASIRDYGLKVQEDKFECNESHCVTPVLLDLAYCIAAATSGKAKRILLAGFDGFPPEEPLSGETDNMLKLYQDIPGSITIISLTSTIHPLDFVPPHSLDS